MRSDSFERATVITFGTFDLFHKGHLRLLERALDVARSKLGPRVRLVVGVSTDALTYKKKKRVPTVPETERKEIVRSLRCVDVVFDEHSLDAKREYCERYDAQILVMGDDHVGEFDWCGIETVYLPRTVDISTTQRRFAVIKDALSCWSKLLVPTALTTCNLASGLAVVLGASEYWLVVGLWCDALDGATARALDACTEFGARYDSAADVVAWAIAPAVLAWRRMPLAAATFATAGVVRLARFTFGETLKGTRQSGGARYFVGLCSPHATMIWLALGLAPLPAFVLAVLEHVPLTFDLKSTPHFPFLPEVVLTLLFFTRSHALVASLAIAAGINLLTTTTIRIPTPRSPFLLATTLLLLIISPPCTTSATLQATLVLGLNFDGPLRCASTLFARAATVLAAATKANITTAKLAQS
ncbi:hypothetical protein CTAYLR_006964 [Chrysophaeum taylorii]|uniref:Cytidyltransferase-like domain-containing protein n=1 Tax=Chrysophaeum taylorii TaxID=2483200 RepID=A0AAD7UFA2_9STRA|nr:hypothetical protein CTAYLR_006964 [Chrysophaeum taylorii]